MADHVKVPVQNARTSYDVGAVATSAFAIPWTFFDEDDILVFIDDVRQALTTDYTVAGTAGTDGGFLGGTMTLVDAVTNSTVKIVRKVPIQRTTDFPISGPINRTAENTQFDKLVAMIQDTDRDAMQLNDAGTEWDALSARVVNVPTPDVSTDASNKAYVDAIRDMLAISDPTSAQIVPSLATAELLTIEPVTTFVMTVGYAEAGDGGGALYKSAASEPSHPGKFQSVDGAWWELVFVDGRVRAQTLGYKIDSDEAGTVGTDNSQAITDCVACPANQVYFPAGYARFLAPVRRVQFQEWRGEGNAIFNRVPNNPVGTVVAGTALIYAGSGNAVAIDSEPGIAFTQTHTSHMSFWTSEDNDCDFIMKLYGARSTFWDHAYFGHRQEELSLGGINSGGCLQIVKNSPETAQTWVHHLLKCEFRCNTLRDTSLGDTDNYEGYAFGFDLDGNDAYIINCKFNNSTLITRQNGGIHAIGTNFENQSAGDAAGTGFDPNANTGRAAWIMIADGDTASLGAWFTGCGFSQADVAGIVDITAASGSFDCLLTITNCWFRRNLIADIRLIQNADKGGSGGSMTGCSFTTATGVLDPDNNGTGTITEPRIDIVNGPWPGFRLAGNVRNLPDVWDSIRDPIIGWHPLLNDTFTGGTVPGAGVIAAGDITSITFAKGMNIADIEKVGTLSSPAFAASTAYLANAIPKLRITSGASAGDDAELFSGTFMCIKTATEGVGGYFARFRFGLATVVAQSRAFVGLCSLTTAIPDAAPSTLLECIGVGFGSAQTTWRALVADPTANEVNEDLGANFPVDNTTVYELSLWTAAAGSRYWVKFENLINSKQFIQHYDDGDGPGSTQRLSPHFWHNNGTTASAVAIDVIAFELRPQPLNPFGGEQ